MYANFTGAREGRAGLGWGQYAIWKAIDDTGPADAGSFNIGRILNVPRRRGACGVDEAAAALATIMSRHDALRARIHLGDDGLPFQEVLPQGRVPLTVAECAEEEADATAAGLLDRLAAEAFDLAGEWPLRAGLVVCGGTVRRIALVLCHTSADGYAADVVIRDLRLLLLRGRPAAAPAMQLLDLVAQEESGAGCIRSGRALAHWEAGYDRIPPAMLPDAHALAGSPRWSDAMLVSPALDAAAPVLAERHHTSTATVLLTAVAVVLQAAMDHKRIAITPIVHNRFAAESHDLVATMTQLALFTPHVDPSASFAEFLDAVRPDALSAYRHSRYDQRRWQRMSDEVSERRGVRVDPSCCFNDQRPIDRGGVMIVAPHAATVPGPEASTLTWLRGVEHFNCAFCFRVIRSDGFLAITLAADTCRLPREEIAGFLRAVEATVTGAV